MVLIQYYNELLLFSLLLLLLLSSDFLTCSKKLVLTKNTLNISQRRSQTLLFEQHNMYSANVGKIEIIQNFYSSNYIIYFITFIIIFVVFITFIFTSITIVSTNC